MCTFFQKAFEKWYIRKNQIEFLIGYKKRGSWKVISFPFGSLKSVWLIPKVFFLFDEKSSNNALHLRQRNMLTEKYVNDR